MDMELRTAEQNIPGSRAVPYEILLQILSGLISATDERNARLVCRAFSVAVLESGYFREPVVHLSHFAPDLHDLADLSMTPILCSQVRILKCHTFTIDDQYVGNPEEWEEYWTESCEDDFWMHE